MDRKSINKAADPSIPVDSAAFLPADKMEKYPIAPFNAQEEYNRLLDEIDEERKRKNISPLEGKERVGELDLYQKLMSKEDRVLTTINRVVDDNEQNRYKTSVLSTDILNMSVIQILLRVSGSLNQLFEDLLRSKNIKDVKRAMSDPLRVPFYGIALVFVAIILSVIYIST